MDPESRMHVALPEDAKSLLKTHVRRLLITWPVSADLGVLGVLLDSIYSDVHTITCTCTVNYKINLRERLASVFLQGKQNKKQSNTKKNVLLIAHHPSSL